MKRRHRHSGTHTHTHVFSYIPGILIYTRYSCAKLFDDPLVKTSTSLVAGKTGGALRASVLAALGLALLFGLCQMVVFTLFAELIVGAFGAGASSPLAAPAAAYVRLRALGAPAVTLGLVSQGIFRGLGDTVTPLLCTAAGNVVNLALDPILIFGLHLGCAGAAGATAAANYCSAIPLLWVLSRRLLSLPAEVGVSSSDDGGDDGVSSSDDGVSSSDGISEDVPSRASILTALRRYSTAAIIVFGRTVGKLWGYGFASRAAATLGPLGAAAYALSFQMGVATTQLCEVLFSREPIFPTCHTPLFVDITRCIFRPSRLQCKRSSLGSSPCGRRAAPRPHVGGTRRTRATYCVAPSSSAAVSQVSSLASRGPLARASSERSLLIRPSARSRSP